MSEVPSLKRLERVDTEILLTWSDGSESKITNAELRYWCPCAKCSPRRDSEELAEYLREEVVAMKNEKPDVRKVGGYALHFEWAEGCSSGIYRFERLFSIASGDDPDGGRPYVHGAW